MADRPGKSKPYTIAQIVKLACVCCGKPAKFQWQCCADDNTWRPVCPDCDIMLNDAFLKLTNDPDRVSKMRKYSRYVRTKKR